MEVSPRRWLSSSYPAGVTCSELFSAHLVDGLCQTRKAEALEVILAAVRHLRRRGRWGQMLVRAGGRASGTRPGPGQGLWVPGAPHSLHLLPSPTRRHPELRKDGRDLPFLFGVSQFPVRSSQTSGRVVTHAVLSLLCAHIT